MTTSSRKPLRIVVHDYSGHPCQVQLSRELARRGHDVVHQYCPAYTTGRGAVDRSDDDPDGFRIEPVGRAEAFARYSPARRLRQEVEYGRLAARAIIDQQPDVALLSNVPLLGLAELSLLLSRARIPYVFWLQDIYSMAIQSVLRRRFGRLAGVPGGVAERLERGVARRSRAVVPISPAFLPALRRWGLPDGKVTVVENWAPIEELPEAPRVNIWTQRIGVADRPRVLYAGTLGLKHDPGLLARLARFLGERADVVVVSEGRGRAYLEQEKAAGGLDNLVLLDFQLWTDLPQVLGSADVLLAILERDVSACSVPSKILSYLCAARPVVAMLAADNPVASILRRADAGTVVPPGDEPAFFGAVAHILASEEEGQRLGRNGRAFADATFDIHSIGSRFEEVLYAAAAPDATRAFGGSRKLVARQELGRVLDIARATLDSSSPRVTESNWTSRSTTAKGGS